MTDPNKSVSLKRRLDEISQSTSEYPIFVAQLEFENSNIRLVNPLRINDEVVYQKDIFSKLKFIYLEQETRDKFLRKISELTIDSIDKNDVKNIEQAAMDRKATFKKLKGELNDQVGTVEQITNEVISLHQELESKLQLTDAIIDEISALEHEVDNIIGDDAPDHNELLKCMLEREGQNKGNFEDLLAMKDYELNDQYTYLSTLVEEIEERKRHNQSQRLLIENLTSKIAELKVVLTGFKNVDTEQADETQIFGKWCKEMNEIILKFTDLQDVLLSLDHNNNFHLSVVSPGVETSLVFNKRFEVLDGDNHFGKQPISEAQFIRKLARFLAI